ncbi:head-tail adaptor protein [uncultured Bradyrhizobium sp.]|uniref:head-tail adaptor protein n=1 Tax=uncultured Bradyrhizobium sp. TaxID=199684 RepID=UPI0035C96877
MTTAGELRHRIAFDRRALIDDGAGNTEGDFEEQFVVSAKVQAKFGGEAVTAARLAGQQPIIVTIRQSSKTVLIGTDWRARDVRSSANPDEQTVYNIRSIADPDDGGAWFEILCQSGSAA